VVKIYLFDSQCRSSTTLLPKNAYSGPLMVVCEKKIFDVMISMLCKACVRSVVVSPSESLLTAKNSSNAICSHHQTWVPEGWQVNFDATGF